MPPRKSIFIFSLVLVMALLFTACTAESEDAGMEDPAVVEDAAAVDEMDTGSEMENKDDVDNSSDSTDSGDDEGSSDAGEGSDQVEVTDGSSTEELTDDEMLALIEEKIEDQHQLDFILGQEKTYDEWVETLDRMIGYGADINEEEKELIINWLVGRKEAMMDESTMEEATMTDEEMIEFITLKVDGKHDVDRIFNADKTYDEWVETLDRMIGYGADINAEEKELIINWLLNR